jgi:hypothetical protein
MLTEVQKRERIAFIEAADVQSDAERAELDWLRRQPTREPTIEDLKKQLTSLRLFTNQFAHYAFEEGAELLAARRAHRMAPTATTRMRRGLAISAFRTARDCFRSGKRGIAYLEQQIKAMEARAA